MWNDGLDFRSSCRWCRKPMLKDELGGGWRLFNSATDFDSARRGKD